jgi:hypothetical protein
MWNYNSVARGSFFTFFKAGEAAPVARDVPSALRRSADGARYR